MAGEGILTKIRSYFKFQLEEDEKILLDERPGTTPSLIVGYLIFLTIFYSPTLLRGAFPDRGVLFFLSTTLLLAVFWFLMVQVRRVIITNKRCIFKMYFVISVPLENFKEARKPKISDFLRPPTTFPFLQWLVIPPSILFKDTVSIVFSDFFIYTCVSDREKFIDEFNKILQAHGLPEVKIRSDEKVSAANRIGNAIKHSIFHRPIDTILIILSLYLFVTMGFLTLIFASPAHISTLDKGDIGDHIIVTGNLRNVDMSGVSFFGKDILYIREGNSILLAEYNAFIADDVYVEGLISEKPVTVSGKFVLKENQLYLNAHFLNTRPTKLFLFSIIILAHFFLTFVGRYVTDGN